jgi:cysteine desulfurase
LLFGGGQERGLRPGTLPVPLIVGLGLASEIAMCEAKERASACVRYRERLLQALMPIKPVINGDQRRAVPHVVNLSFPGIDSEGLMVALKDLIAISNGSACTSQNYSPSHVLKAMGAEDWVVRGAVRLSWCHLTQGPNWESVADTIRQLM